MRPPAARGTPADRIARNVDVVPDGCWIWMLARNKSGYGVLKVYGKLTLAHRLAYEVFEGPIPAGLQLDHLCRVRHCVNPDHLEPVTGGENVRRSPIHNRAKTHCHIGHPFDVANTRIRANGQRECRACRAARAARYRAALLAT